jgi:ankyrin repeat protein
MSSETSSDATGHDYDSACNSEFFPELAYVHQADWLDYDLDDEESSDSLTFDQQELSLWKLDDVASIVHDLGDQLSQIGRSQGNALLQRAVNLRDVESVRTLLRSGSAVCDEWIANCAVGVPGGVDVLRVLVDEFGLRLVDVQVGTDDADVLRFLLERGVVLDAHALCASATPAEIKAVAAKSASPDDLLLFAVDAGNEAAALALLDEGVAAPSVPVYARACMLGFAALVDRMAAIDATLLPQLARDEPLLAESFGLRTTADIARRLLDAGASAQIVAEAAIVLGLADVLELALVRGVDDRALVPKAFRYWPFPGSLAVFEQLVAAGCDVAAVDADSGHTALHFAAVHSFPVEFFERLLERVPQLLDVRDSLGRTALVLHCTCVVTPIDAVVVLLVERGAAWRCEEPNEFSVPLWLAQRGCVRGLEALAARGLDVAATPDLLQCACRWHHVELVRWLVARGADVHATSDRFGGRDKTALFVAAELHVSRAAREIVRVLVAAGADVEQECGFYEDESFTPLQIAVVTENSSVIGPLITCGADPTDLCYQAATGGDWQSLVALAASGVDLACDEELVEHMFGWLTSADQLGVAFLLLELGLIEDGEHCNCADLAAALDLFDVPLRSKDRFTHTPLFALRKAVVCQQWRAFRRDLVAMKLDLINDMAVNVCIILQPLDLPVLLTVMILDELCPLAPLVSMYLKWALAARVKHFTGRRQ